MTPSIGMKRWASRYGPTRGRWLQEEFDQIDRGSRWTSARSGSPTDAAHASDRLPVWEDEVTYDAPEAGGCCGERPSPFPDPRILMSHDWEK